MGLLVDILGWIGSGEILLAFFLISTNRIDAQSSLYQLLNLTGGFFLVANTLYYKAYPASFLNLSWSLIAIYALLKSIRKQKER